MPFALDGTHGTTVIESQGQAHRIVFEMDPVRREPRILREVMSSDVQNGTRITVRWPKTACHLLAAAKHRFVQMACAFTTFNPHLTMRGRWNDGEFLAVPATDREWRKWRTCDPTSAFWYSAAQFECYMAAHIARDEDQGRAGRTVRDFIAELRGLSRSGKQKLVLAETGTSGVSLASFFGGGRGAIAGLLNSCKRHSKSVKPEDLGLIGADHLLEDCCKLGAARESFRYRKHLNTTAEGVPYAIEVAFAYCPERNLRQAIAGVNFSVAIDNPFQRLGPFESLTSVLARQHIDFDDPVVVVLHYTCPRVDFSDRGKSSLTLPREVGHAFGELLKAVTKEWIKQRAAELRSDAAKARRDERLRKQQNRPERPETPQPTGTLATKITRAAMGAGVSIDELTVLSPGNDPYTAWRHRRQAEWFAALFARLVPTGKLIHLRAFFYLLIGRAKPGPAGKQFVNDEKHWQMLLIAAKAARWLDLVPFERIIDARNPRPVLYVPGPFTPATSVNPGEACEIPLAAAALPRFSLDGFHGRQTHRIILYGEKSSLAEILDPIAREIGAELILTTGESSDTYIAGAAKRISADGRPAAVLYFSDFDPSGRQMPISVAQKLRAMRDLRYPDIKFKLHHVALTLEQVRRLGLPSSPFKATEKRARAWRQAMGHEQTEIDAMIGLHPEALRAAVYDAIAPYYDAQLDTRVLQAEGKWLKDVAAELKDDPGYQAGIERIKAARKAASDAAIELGKEQAKLAKILKKSVPEAPELPQAEPKGAKQPALFDSEDNFVTASRRLIDYKKLVPDMDNE
jgi:hypothetical protein